MGRFNENFIDFIRQIINITRHTKKKNCIFHEELCLMFIISPYTLPKLQSQDRDSESHTVN